MNDEILNIHKKICSTFPIKEQLQYIYIYIFFSFLIPKLYVIHSVMGYKSEYKQCCSHQETHSKWGIKLVILREKWCRGHSRNFREEGFPLRNICKYLGLIGLKLLFWRIYFFNNHNFLLSSLWGLYIKFSKWICIVEQQLHVSYHKPMPFSK